MQYLNLDGLAHLWDKIKAEINKKAPLSHTHEEYLLKDGGTMSGDLTLTDGKKIKTTSGKNIVVFDSSLQFGASDVDVVFAGSKRPDVINPTDGTDRGNYILLKNDFQVMTQSEYDGLPTKNPNVFYFIREG